MKKFRKYRRGGDNDDDEDDEENENNNEYQSSDDSIRPFTSRIQKWLRWEKPRGTNKVMMREAEALGGIPRSDRYSSRDWWHNTISLLNSNILRDIRSPVLAMTFWGFLVAVLHHYSSSTPGPLHRCMSLLYMPPTAHSLTMSALALLLVFRTNSAYQRFNEGRIIWEKVVNSSRDLYRNLMLYSNEIGIEKRRRIQGLLAAFPYLLRHRIRPTSVVMHRLDHQPTANEWSDRTSSESGTSEVVQQRWDPENFLLLYQDAGPTDNDEEAGVLARAEEETGTSRRQPRPVYYVDKRTLPWRLLPPDALKQCARAQNRPLWVCDRMAQELRRVPDQDEDGRQFTARERMGLLSHVDRLSRCIGGAERIHQTVVPLNYARHTLRALTLWLASLPLALVRDLKFMTGPVLFLLSWLLFGVYEIGYAIEDPFQGTLRLSILCDTIRRDVLVDENTRGTAFEISEVSSSTEISSSSATGKSTSSSSQDSRHQSTSTEDPTPSSSTSVDQDVDVDAEPYQ